jgi:DNA-binding NarL/FixJ family response regulator
MSETSAGSQTIITIGIVDDHPVFTEALALVFGKEPTLQVVGVADTCAGARDLVERTRPNVLLLDVSLPDGDGLNLVPELKRLCPETHILVLTSYTEEKTLLRAIETGVIGFVGKNRTTGELFAAIRRAAEGEITMPTGLLLGLLARTRREHTHDLAKLRGESLTPREQEVLAQLAQGHSSTAIASELDISPMTVRTHIRNLMEKLGVHSRLEAVTVALRNGLIQPPV